MPRAKKIKSRRSNKKIFKKGAKVHKMNKPKPSARGGIRL